MVIFSTLVRILLVVTSYPIFSHGESLHRGKYPLIPIQFTSKTFFWVSPPQNRGGRGPYFTRYPYTLVDRLLLICHIYICVCVCVF